MAPSACSTGELGVGCHCALVERQSSQLPPGKSPVWHPGVQKKRHLIQKVSQMFASQAAMVSLHTLVLKTLTSFSFALGTLPVNSS